VLLGLGPEGYDALLLALPGREVDPVAEVRRLADCAGDALVFVLVDANARASAIANAVNDVVGLFDAGADDVITDPLSPDVLAARIRAWRRRGDAGASGRSDGLLGDLVLDRSARRCLIRDREVPLRAKELDLLDALAARAGRVVSRSVLMSVVWDEHWFRSTKTLDVTMAGLRRQLREVAAAVGGVVPEIMTIRGVGYRLDPPGRVDLARVR
jgi:DNA-binding response OmpR family regulator